MRPLPFAPRPLAGEGLSSWVARLAFHNFVTPADLWADLGSDDVTDLAPNDSLLKRLSARTRLDVHDLRRRFASGLAAAAPLALSEPGATRGAACPACCRATAEVGGDHFVSTASASVWRFSCPEHRIRLVDLDGYALVLQAGAARFLREGTSLVIGATALTSRLAAATLALEETMMSALGGRAPGPEWLPRTATSFLASATTLIEMVLWRPMGGFPFAHRFDEIGNNGSPTAFVEPDDRRRGVGLLADLSPRHRLNVCAALATLLARPAARRHPDAMLMDWNDPDRPGPFAFMIGEFDGRLRELIARRIETWPDCIATSARQALREAR